MMNDVQEARNNLNGRFDLLGDLEKSNKLLLDWINYIEDTISNDSYHLNDLVEKRGHLEKFKIIEKDIGTYKTTVDKLESKLYDHPNI